MLSDRLLLVDNDKESAIETGGENSVGDRLELTCRKRTDGSIRSHTLKPVSLRGGGGVLGWLK